MCRAAAGSASAEDFLASVFGKQEEAGAPAKRGATGKTRRFAVRSKPGPMRANRDITGRRAYLSPMRALTTLRTCPTVQEAHQTLGRRRRLASLRSSCKHHKALLYHLTVHACAAYLRCNDAEIHPRRLAPRPPQVEKYL